jgi:hypothetical protein
VLGWRRRVRGRTAKRARSSATGTSSACSEPSAPTRDSACSLSVKPSSRAWRRRFRPQYFLTRTGVT